MDVKIMHKTDLVTAVAEQTGLSKDKADILVAALLEQITNALSRAQNVTLVGFGSFNLSSRAARSGHNPQTGASIEIAARNSVIFKPGKALKEAINSPT
jgi:nucleoid DNA-binding protein